MQVNPADLENAARLLDEASQHYRACQKEMQANLDDNFDNNLLTGGWGKTGGFRKGLQNFSIEFNKVLGEFVADEDKFCLFLEEFSVRLRQSAQTYQHADLAGAESMSRITNRLDSGQA